MRTRDNLRLARCDAPPQLAQQAHTVQLLGTGHGRDPRPVAGDAASVCSSGCSQTPILSPPGQKKKPAPQSAVSEFTAQAQKAQALVGYSGLLPPCNVCISWADDGLAYPPDTGGSSGHRADTEVSLNFSCLSPFYHTPSDYSMLQQLFSFGFPIIIHYPKSELRLFSCQK